MSKNLIKLLRNPNSPEAIQARADGYQLPPFESTCIINDPDQRLIIVDLTTSKINQKVNYALSGGTKDQMQKKLIKSSLMLDSQGRSVLTNYFTDIRNGQWLMVKQFYDKLPITGPDSLSSPTPFPKPTFGGSFGGFGSSAPGETWYNQGRSIKKLREAQQREINDVPVDPNSNQDKENPTDHFFDDFTGER